VVVVAVHIAAATWRRPKGMFQTSGLPEKFLKTQQMDTAKTDETSFGGFVTMLPVHFRKNIWADLGDAGLITHSESWQLDICGEGEVPQQRWPG
jgi:hypothetical protein